MPNVALKKPVEEPIINSASATDGEVTEYTAFAGFAESAWPCLLTVDLGESYDLSCIRLLLWDGLGKEGKARANRIYKYRLLTSTDHQTWKVIFDSSNDGSNGWQVFNFSQPLNARYIRIHGLWNSANANFQVVQIEAHDTAPSELDAEIILQRTIQTDSLEEEIGDGLPLQARVGGIINGIERLIEDNELLNPKPFRELISQLRVQVRDVGALERGMDSIRREIISPVRQELEHSAKLGRFSVWGFWVGLIGGVLAIISIVLALAQWFGSNPQLTSQSNTTPSQVQSTDSVELQKIQGLEVSNPPKRFTTAKGIVAAREMEWVLTRQDTLIQTANGERMAVPRL